MAKAWTQRLQLGFPPLSSVSCGQLLGLELCVPCKTTNYNLQKVGYPVQNKFYRVSFGNVDYFFICVASCAVRLH